MDRAIQHSTVSHPGPTVVTNAEPATPLSLAHGGISPLAVFLSHVWVDAAQAEEAAASATQPQPG